jgi:hypothetical protein
MFQLFSLSYLSVLLFDLVWFGFVRLIWFCLVSFGFVWFCSALFGFVWFSLFWFGSVNLVSFGLVSSGSFRLRLIWIGLVPLFGCCRFLVCFFSFVTLAMLLVSAL